MSDNDLMAEIDGLYEHIDRLSPSTPGPWREAVEEALTKLDRGELRVAEKIDGVWHTSQWLKKAILLSFKMNNMTLSGTGGGLRSWDKIPSKFKNWGKADFVRARFRIVSGAIVRRSAYIGADAVVMPSFINMGAHVGEKTMIDTWSTVGSCAQVGRECHISGGVGLGGVLEPLQANPVIIEDNCFIGARSEVVEGVIVEKGSVLAMGVFLSASTKIVNRTTGEILTGRVPEYSVVVPGILPGDPLPNGSPGPSLACAVIVKQVDARTRAKTSLNELLRL